MGKNKSRTDDCYLFHFHFKTLYRQRWTTSCSIVGVFLLWIGGLHTGWNARQWWKWVGYSHIYQCERISYTSSRWERQVLEECIQYDTSYLFKNVENNILLAHGVDFTVFMFCILSVLYNTFKERGGNCGNGKGLKVDRDGPRSQEEPVQRLGVPALGSQACGRWPWVGKVVGAQTVKQGSSKRRFPAEEGDERYQEISLSWGCDSPHRDSLPWPKVPGEECPPSSPNSTELLCTLTLGGSLQGLEIAFFFPSPPVWWVVVWKTGFQTRSACRSPVALHPCMESSGRLGSPIFLDVRTVFTLALGVPGPCSWGPEYSPIGEPSTGRFCGLQEVEASRLQLESPWVVYRGSASFICPWWAFCPSQAQRPHVQGGTARACGQGYPSSFGVGVPAARTEAEAWESLGTICKCGDTYQTEGKKESDVKPKPEIETICM